MNPNNQPLADLQCRLFRLSCEPFTHFAQALLVIPMLQISSPVKKECLDNIDASSRCFFNKGAQDGLCWNPRAEIHEENGHGKANGRGQRSPQNPTSSALSGATVDKRSHQNIYSLSDRGLDGICPQKQNIKSTRKFRDRKLPSDFLVRLFMGLPKVKNLHQPSLGPIPKAYRISSNLFFLVKTGTT